MAYPVIRINNVTGSDTQASGAGPDPAIYGMQAMTDSAGTTVDLSMDNPDLSGVATDGSHAIYLSGTGGRLISKITGVDNTAKTVTVTPAFPANLSGLSWAIGGKRNTFDQILLDQLDYGWYVDLENTGTDYIFPDGVMKINAALATIMSSSPNSPTLRSNSPTQQLIDHTTVNQLLVVRNIKLFTSDGSYPVISMDSDPSNRIGLCMIECEIGAAYFAGFTALIDSSISFHGCVLKPDSNRDYCCLRLGDVSVRLYGCTFDIPTGYLGLYNRYNGGKAALKDCIFRGGYNGVNITGEGFFSLENCTFIDQSSDCVYSVYSEAIVELINCLFSGSGGYAVRVYNAILKNCAFHNNTSGNLYYDPIINEDQIILTEDPFVDRLNGNYALNDAPGGGKLLKDAGWPQTWPGLPNTTSYPDIGAVESQAGAGSSSGPPILIPRPVRRGWI